MGKPPTHFPREFLIGSALVTSWQAAHISDRTVIAWWKPWCWEESIFWYGMSSPNTWLVLTSIRCVRSVAESGPNRSPDRIACGERRNEPAPMPYPRLRRGGGATAQTDTHPSRTG